MGRCWAGVQGARAHHACPAQAAAVGRPRHHGCQAAAQPEGACGRCWPKALLPRASPTRAQRRCPPGRLAPSRAGLAGTGWSPTKTSRGARPRRPKARLLGRGPPARQRRCWTAAARPSCLRRAPAAVAAAAAAAAAGARRTGRVEARRGPGPGTTLAPSCCPAWGGRRPRLPPCWRPPCTPAPPAAGPCATRRSPSGPPRPGRAPTLAPWWGRWRCPGATAAWAPRRPGPSPKAWRCRWRCW